MSPRPFFPKGADFLSCTDTGRVTFRDMQRNGRLRAASIARIPPESAEQNARWQLDGKCIPSRSCRPVAPLLDEVIGRHFR